mgnify:CR=1 FL=1
MKKLLLLLLIAPVLGFGQKNYLVRIDYDTGNSPTSSIQIQNSYFTDDLVNVYVAGNDQVDFNFPNELFPPTNIIGYFYNANSDKYTISTFGLGNNAYVLGYWFESTKDTSNQAQNDFFGAFKDYYVGINMNPGNYGGVKKNLPPIYVHAYLYFTFADENNGLAFNPPTNDTPVLFPNPTSSLLALNSDKEYDIEVYDMAGNKVMTLTGNTINMSHLSSATYIVKALDKVENEEVSYKVVKN